MGGIANSWLLGNEWDAVMNYQFSSAVLSLWRDSTFTDNDHNASSSAGELNPISMSQFDERIHNLMERYAPEALYAMLNLFGSHDTNRTLFMLDENTNTADPSIYLNPPNYDWSPAIAKLKQATAIQMTMPGARPFITVMKSVWSVRWSKMAAASGRMILTTASPIPGWTRAARLSTRTCNPRLVRIAPLRSSAL